MQTGTVTTAWQREHRIGRLTGNEAKSPSAACDLGLTRFDGHPSSGVYPGRMSDHGEHGEEAPAAPPCVHA